MNRLRRFPLFVSIVTAGIIASQIVGSAAALAAPKNAPLQRVVTSRVAHLTIGQAATFRAALWGGDVSVRCDADFRSGSSYVEVYVQSDGATLIEAWSPNYGYEDTLPDALMTVVSIDALAQINRVTATSSMRAVRNNRTLRIEAAASVDKLAQTCDISYTVEESDNN